MNEITVTDLIDILRHSSPFNQLTDDDLAGIASLCRVEQHEIGSVIFSEGQEADHLYIMVEGMATLDLSLQFGPGRTPRKATVETVAPGEPLGWSSLVEPYKYTMSAICLEPSTIIAIPAQELREFLTQCPAGLTVMKQLTQLIVTRLKNERHTMMHALAILSHDLKAPLNAVESYNQVLLGEFAGPINDEQREMLERNSVRIKELLTLINDLLDVSRIGTGSLAREFEMVSLAKIGQTCLSVVQPLGADKGVTVEGEFPPELPEIVAAGSRLQQAITNLLSNAVKFTPGGGKVTLTLEDRGDHIQTEVIDTGVGISPEDLPHIFDDFYTGNNVEGKGQGLGLSIAKKIVEGHKGRIWAESPYPSEGRKGSRFIFTIPKNLAPIKTTNNLSK